MSEQPDPEMDEEEELHRFDPQLALADERYEVIGSILCEVYEPGDHKWILSDMLDRVLLHKYL